MADHGKRRIKIELNDSERPSLDTTLDAETRAIWQEREENFMKYSEFPGLWKRQKAQFEDDDLGIKRPRVYYPCEYKFRGYGKTTCDLTSESLCRTCKIRVSIERNAWYYLTEEETEARRAAGEKLYLTDQEVEERNDEDEIEACNAEEEATTVNEEEIEAHSAAAKVLVMLHSKRESKDVRAASATDEHAEMEA